MNLPLRERLPKILVFIFFSIFLWAGIRIHGDYGLQVDSIHSFNRGLASHDYIMKYETIYKDKFDTHGWVFDAVVHFILSGLNITDSSDFYKAKHLMTFLLFFVSVIFFYRLCRDHFGSWKLGLAGSLFLVLSPRIFAHSFYNPKDSPCLDIFVISIYTLMRYLDEKTYSRAAVHALTCALLVAIRNLGVLVPALTVLIVVMDLLCCPYERVHLKRIAGSVVLFGTLCTVLIILFWPVLWQHPLDQFIYGFNEMKRYNHNARMIYMGDVIFAHRLPWHYIPVWVIITTPLVYVALFCFGVGEGIGSFIRKDLAYSFKRNTLIFLVWFFAPVAAIIVFHSVVYNAWRQMMFVYPGFLILSLGGILFFNRMILHVFNKARAKLVRAFLVGVIAFSLVPVLFFMIRSHPIQDVYFNELVGGVKGAKYCFDVEYWGIAYRKALEYVLAHDSGEKIKVCAQYGSAMIRNAAILTPLERARLEFVELKDAQYFISTFMGGEESPFYKEIYSFKVDEAKVMAVYKLE